MEGRMSKELDEKWRELVAAGRAEWVPRMVDQAGWTFIEHTDHGEAAFLWVADDGCEWLRVEGRLPDWSDPATLGCLLGQVEARYGGPVSVFYTHDGECSIRVGRLATAGGRYFSGATKAEVLLRALECAP